MSNENVAAGNRCPNCEMPVRVGVLLSCMICRSQFCERCSVRGYGRDFCSVTCRDMFFFGDGDDIDENTEE
jgi:hypothetical protein